MRLLLFLFVCLAWWGSAFGEVVVVMQPWVQVRALPKNNAKPIAIVYANDSYDVLKEQELWVQIRTAAKVTGWVPRNTVYPIIEPIARKALAFATELKNAGKEREARAKLFEILRRFPGTVQSYEATRLLETYHPGHPALPDPVNGKPDPKAKALAERTVTWLLVEEGRLLIREKRYEEAASMFEEARAHGKVNRTAMDGIRDAMQTQYREADSKEKTKTAELALRSYFPNVENPLTFTISPFGLPPTVPPQMAPLVTPPPPIEEEDRERPGLHDFEKKELEMAPAPGESEVPGKRTGPSGAEAPAQPKDGQPEAKPKDSGREQSPPPEMRKPEAGTEKPAKPAPQRKPVKSSALRTPDEGQPKSVLPVESPAQAPADVPADAPATPRNVPPLPKPRTPARQAQLAPGQGPALPARQAEAPATPRDLPPGFAPGNAGTAQTDPPEQEATVHPLTGPMKGLWPAARNGDSADSGPATSSLTAAAIRPPAPPPSFSELAEGPSAPGARR